MKFSPSIKRIFRTESERERDLEEILELKHQGMTWAEITDALNERDLPYKVTQREIAQQYHAFVDRHTDQIDTDLQRSLVLDDLDRLFQLAYEGYRSSLNASNTSQIEELPVSGDAEDLRMAIVKHVKTKRDGQPNNAFLTTMLKVIEARAKLLSLNEETSTTQIILPQVTQPAAISEPIRSEHLLLNALKELEKK